MISGMPDPITITVPVLSPLLSPVHNQVGDGARLGVYCVTLQALHTIMTRDYIAAHRVADGVPQGARLHGLFVETAGVTDVSEIRLHLIFEHPELPPVRLGACIPKRETVLATYGPAFSELYRLVQVMRTKAFG